MEINQNLCLLYGKETYFLENTLKKIKKDFGTMVKGINFVSLEQTNISNLVEEIETPAFGYEKKLIIARDTGLFKKTSKKTKNVSSDFASKLTEYFENHQKEMKESVVLVFVEEEVDKNDLYKQIEKQGIVQAFEEQKPAQLVTKLQTICKAYEVNVENSLLMYVIELCGTNMQELINEVRKLIEYAGKGRNYHKRGH